MAIQRQNSDHNRKPSRAHQKPQREIAAQSLSPVVESPTLLLQRAIQDPGAASPGDILTLQRASGNQAVSQLIQAKLTVGPVGDSYEQEADRVADRVMAMPAPASPGSVRRQEDEEALQMKPLAATITPVIQRQEDEEEDLIQMQPLAQRQEDEEEELIQMQPLIRRAADDGSFEAGSDVEQALASRQGNGTPLPGDVRDFMEPRFGADFSNVRVHSDGKAGELSQAIQAKAFTHGQDIYFGKGQFSPETSAGKRLLAHELTHVVQQAGGGSKIQRWGGYKGGTTHEVVTEEAFQGVEGYSEQAKEYLVSMSEAMDARGSFWMGLAAGMLKQSLSKIAKDPDAYDNLEGYWRPSDEAPNHGEGGQYKRDGTARDEAHVNSFLDRAKNAWDSNNRTQALTMLALGLHAAEDRGAHGDGRPGEGHDPRRSIKPPEGAKVTQYYIEGWDGTDCDKRSHNPGGYQRGVQYGRALLTEFKDYVATEKGDGERLEKFDKKMMDSKRRWRKWKTWWGAGYASEEREEKKGPSITEPIGKFKDPVDWVKTASDPVGRLNLVVTLNSPTEPEKGEKEEESKPLSKKEQNEMIDKVFTPEERISLIQQMARLEEGSQAALITYLKAYMENLTTGERIAIIRQGRAGTVTVEYYSAHMTDATPAERIAILEMGMVGHMAPIEPAMIEFLRANVAKLTNEERAAVAHYEGLIAKLGTPYINGLAKRPGELLEEEKRWATSVQQAGWEQDKAALLADPEALKKEKARLAASGELQWWSDAEEKAAIEEHKKEAESKKTSEEETAKSEEDTSKEEETPKKSEVTTKKSTSKETTSQESTSQNAIQLRLRNGHYEWLRPAKEGDDGAIKINNSWYVRVGNKGGGDCQFHSIAQGLKFLRNETHTVEDLRRIVATTLRQHAWVEKTHIEIENSLENQAGLSTKFRAKVNQQKQHFAGEAGTGMSEKEKADAIVMALFDDYITAMQTDSGMWGNELTLEVFRKHFNLTINVKTEGSND